MICPVCSTEMSVRTGRYGQFYYCTKNSKHPTVKYVSEKNKCSHCGGLNGTHNMFYCPNNTGSGF